MTNISTLFSNRPSLPPRQKPSEAPVAPAREDSIQDAFVKSESPSGFGMGALAFAALGAVTVVTPALAQNVQAAPIDLAVEKTAPVTDARAQVAAKQLDVTLSNDFWGNLDYKGSWGDQKVDMSVSKNIWGNHDLKGQWGGDQLHLNLDKTLFGNLDVNGKWGADKVDLGVDKTLWGHNIGGTWGGQKVDIDIQQGWGGALNVDGKWGNDKVDLKMKTTWTNGVKLTGEWGGEKVDLRVRENWLGQTEVDGKAPKQAVIPWMISNFLQRQAAESSSN